MAMRFACVLSLLLALVGAAASAQVTAGKNSAFVTESGLTLNDGPTGVAPLLQVTLPKGRKKSVIAASGTLQVDVSAPSLPSLEVHVNGVVAMGPVVSTDCKYIAVTRCTLAGSWYLDLDLAELANPGVFIGEPLVVELVGGTNTYSPPNTATAAAGLSVQMVKK
jgi:hypothetical protein